MSKDTSLMPDIGFVGIEKVRQFPAPGTRERKKYVPMASDLAVEVASPDQYRPEMAEKAWFYLAHSASLVWIIWPSDQQVDVWRPGTDQPLVSLSAGDTFDGPDVVSGFAYAVSDLSVQFLPVS